VQSTNTISEISNYMFFLVKYSGELKPKEHEEIKWIGIDEIDRYDFMDADKKVVEEMKKRWNEIKK